MYGEIMKCETNLVKVNSCLHVYHFNCNAVKGTDNQSEMGSFVFMF